MFLFGKLLPSFSGCSCALYHWLLHVLEILEVWPWKPMLVAFQHSAFISTRGCVVWQFPLQCHETLPWAEWHVMLLGSLLSTDNNHIVFFLALNNEKSTFNCLPVCLSVGAFLGFYNRPNQHQWAILSPWCDSVSV